MLRTKLNYEKKWEKFGTLTWFNGAVVESATEDVTDDVGEEDVIDAEIWKLLLTVLDADETGFDALLSVMILKNWLAIRWLPAKLCCAGCVFSWLDVDDSFVDWVVGVALCFGGNVDVGDLIELVVLNVLLLVVVRAVELDVGDMDIGDCGETIGDMGMEVQDDGVDE